jgi:hypothetical protein
MKSVHYFGKSCLLLSIYLVFLLLVATQHTSPFSRFRHLHVAFSQKGFWEFLILVEQIVGASFLLSDAVWPDDPTVSGNENHQLSGGFVLPRWLGASYLAPFYGHNVSNEMAW